MGNKTDLFALLDTVKHLSNISIATLKKLSSKLSIEPETLAILICLYGGSCNCG